MSGSNVTMADLKKWIIDTLLADSTYGALCVSTVGSALNYYKSSPADHPVEAKPFFTAFSDESRGDFTGQSEFVNEWIIPVAIGIVGNDTPVVSGGVTGWDSSDKVERLAVAAVKILKQNASDCGIIGEDIQVLRYNLVATEIGAADDVQANLFITFGKINSL